MKALAVRRVLGEETKKKEIAVRGVKYALHVTRSGEAAITDLSDYEKIYSIQSLDFMGDLEGGFRTMDRPMMTNELFYKIQDILKEKGRLPEILDYGIAADRPVPIRRCEFALKSNLDYGGSEGIYLDLWITCFEEGDETTYSLGTFKTLDDSDEAMHIMAGLLANFIIEGTAYIGRHQDDFTWEGMDVRALDENGTFLSWRYSGCSRAEALKKRMSC